MSEQEGCSSKTEAQLYNKPLCVRSLGRADGGETPESVETTI